MTINKTIPIQNLRDSVGRHGYYIRITDAE
jgi:hypothetical protein